jgi:hypothetical protein
MGRYRRQIISNRYYDPATRPFLSVDPLVAKTGQPDAFSEDDPIGVTDPFDLKFSPSGRGSPNSATIGCTFLG